MIKTKHTNEMADKLARAIEDELEEINAFDVNEFFAADWNNAQCRAADLRKVLKKLKRIAPSLQESSFGYV